MLHAVVAWLIAAGCVAVVALRLRRMARLELPSADVLIERAQRSAADDDPELARRLALVELDEQLGDIDHETRAGAELPRSVARVSLASGTALALLALIQRTAEPPWVAICAAFFAGLAGTTGASLLGRMAEARARRAREHWAAVVRRAYTRLEATTPSD